MKTEIHPRGILGIVCRVSGAPWGEHRSRSRSFRSWVVLWALVLFGWATWKAPAASGLPIRWRQTGTWPGHTRGVARDLALQGDRLALALDDGGWAILDVRHPGQPALLGSNNGLGFDGGFSPVSTIDLDGDRLYAAADFERFLVYDISDPRSPDERNRWVDEAVWPWVIRGRGDQVFLLLEYGLIDDEWVSGIQVYEVTTSGMPRLRGSLWFDDAEVNGLAMVGDLAFIADSEGLRVVDVSKPEQLKELAFLKMDWSPSSIQAVDHLVYLGTVDGLEVVDIRDPSKPVVLGRWQTPGGVDWITGVSIWGTRAYLAAGRGGIYVVDITRPADLRMIAHRTGIGDVEKVRANETWVWALVDGDLHTYPATLGEAETALVQVPLSGSSKDLAIAGNRVLVADDEGGLLVLEASSSGSMRLLDRWNGAGAVRAVVVEGSTAYLANNALGLQIADLSDPSKFLVLTNVPVTGLPLSLAVEGGLALVGSEMDGLHLVDVGDPTKVREWGGMLGTVPVRRVILRGGRASVLAGDRSVYFLDVRQPAAPLTLGVLNGPRSVGDIAWVGDHLYVVDSNEVRVYDVANPAEPKQVGSLEMNFYGAHRIVVDDGLAFVAAAADGVRVLDVRVPSQPRFLAALDTAGDAMGLGRVGNEVYVADGPNGVVVFEPDLDPSNPPEIVGSPAGISAAPGTSVSLDVLAGGGEPLRFQWRKNGVNLAGETNDVLVLTDLTVTHGGSYSVVVSNPHGLVQSGAAVVRVQGLASGLSDDFEDADLDTGGSGVLADPSDLATLENDEPRHAGKWGNRSLWMSWRPGQSGIATVSTEGSSYDTLLGVYTGETLTHLTEVASDDDRGEFLASKVMFNVDSNQVYHLAIANYGPSTGATSVKIADGRAFVVDEDFGLLVLDLSVPDSPVLIGTYPDEDWPVAVAIEGEYAYLVDDLGLSVLDLRDPTTPVRVGFLSLPEPGWSIAAGSGYAIVADDVAGWLVVDVRQPDRPRLVAQYVPDGDWEGWATLVDFDGRYAYLYDIYELIILDLARPDLPVAVWREEVFDGITDLQVSEGYLYWAVDPFLGESSLQVYDIQDPTDVWLVGEAKLQVPATAVTVEEGTAYVVDSNGRVHAVDVSEPDAPRVLDGTYRSTASALDVAVVNGRALIANGASGLLVLDVTDPDRMRPVGGVTGFQGNAVVSWELEPTDQRLPVITRQPSPRTLAALGATASLSVEVDRPVGGTFEWLFNGQTIPGATESTLTLSPALPRHAGTYRVRVTNAEGRRVESQDAQFELVTHSAGGTRQVSEYKLLDLFEQSGGVRPAAASGQAHALAGAPSVNQGSGSQWSRTTEVPIPAVILEGCDVVGTQGRWFYFVAPGTGSMDFNTVGSEVRTVLAVFTNRFSLKLVDCAVQLEGQSATRLSLRVTQGHEYFFLVASADGRSGSLQFNNDRDEERLAHWETRVLQGRFFFWGAVPPGQYQIDERWSHEPSERWQVRTNVPCAGRLEFLDSQEANESARFYRVVPMP
jgi:hypothetical protein